VLKQILCAYTQVKEAFRRKNERYLCQRKFEVEPVFGVLKAHLHFIRFSLRGKWKVENEVGLAFMAVNLKKINGNSIRSVS